MRRSRLLRTVGIVVIVLGVFAGVALWLVAGTRYDNAVADLAPAPIGCATTLVFDHTGTYTFFVETQGSIDQIDGDCQTEARSYDVAVPPRVVLALSDASGQALDLGRASGPSYDRGGRRGVGVRTVDIESTGDYVLTASADATDAVIRVGRDPSSGVAAIRVAAVLVLLAGVAGGVILLVAGRPRRAPAPIVPPGPQWPTGLSRLPPAGPPTANPTVPPPYLPRPPSFAPPPQPARPGTAAGPPVEPPLPPGGWPGSGGPLPPPRPPS